MLRLRERLAGLLLRLLARERLFCLLLLFRLLGSALAPVLRALLRQSGQGRFTLRQQGNVRLPHLQRSAPLGEIGKLLA